MIKYIIGLMMVCSLVITGCTPTIDDGAINVDDADSTAAQKNDDETAEKDSTTEVEADEAADGKEVSEVNYNNYKNPAVGYSIDIPSNWYWRHYHKAEIILSNPNVDDYLLISPTHNITGFQTESPAEIIVEVSGQDLSDFNDASLAQSVVSVAGQSATKFSGVINNEVFSDYQKIEYQFVRDGKTFRIIYLAAAGLENNETVFEAMVKSFSFSE